MKKLLLILSFSTVIGTAQNPAELEKAYGGLPGTGVTAGFDDAIFSIQIQNDGKYIVGGQFASYKGLSQNRLIRINPDGTKDTSFDVASGFNNNVNVIGLQNDGKLLVGGVFTNYQGESQNYLIRLNTDGSKDTSFAIGTGFNNSIQTIQIQNDGKILVGGDFTIYQGESQNYLVRLNTDGSKDTSFAIGSGFNNQIQSLCIQNDGKIVIGGSFTTYQGVTQNRLIRLDLNGSKDVSFDVGSGFNNQIQSLSIQNDGKILVGGAFATFQGQSQSRLVRLNSDGSKDTSFNIGSGFNNFVLALQPLTDGKIMVGGRFSAFQGQNQNRLIRLNADGTKDFSFDIGSGFDSYVNSIQVLSDQKILIGGSYSSYKNTVDTAVLVRLYGNSLLSSSEMIFENHFSIVPNPFIDTFTITPSADVSIEKIELYDLNGKLLMESIDSSLNLSSLNRGVYILKIVAENQLVTKKLVKN